MPTDVIKTIAATSSPTTPDYSTLAAWEAFVDGVGNLVTADERHIGECLDQGEFTGAGPVLDIGGQTTDATRCIILRCASGASFRDKAGVRTTALAYNASNGVAIRATSGNYTPAINVNSQYVLLQSLQVAGNRWGIKPDSGGALLTIDSCIVRSNNSGEGVIGTDTAGGYGLTVVNCLLHNETSGLGVYAYHGPHVHGCTIICTGGGYGVASRYGTATATDSLTNNAIFGATTPISSYSSGACSYNATDAAAITGTNSLTSLTFSSQVENTTSDFRAKSTGGLQAGTPDATNTPDDITGLTRDATTPWIGCWEVSGGGGSDVSVDVPAGVLAFTGVAPAAARTAVVPVSTITFAGVAPTTQIAATLSPGVITFTGTAPASRNLADVTPGVITFAGVAPVASLTAAVSAGSLTFIGVALIASTTAAVTPGTISFVGPSQDVQTGASFSSGVITFAGNPPSSNGTATVPAGAFTLAGVVPVAGQAASVSAGLVEFFANPRNDIQEVYFNGGTSGTLALLSVSPSSISVIANINSALSVWQAQFAAFGTVTSISGGLRFEFSGFAYANREHDQFSILVDATNGSGVTIAVIQHGREYPVTAEQTAPVPVGQVTFTGVAATCGIAVGITPGEVTFVGVAPAATSSASVPAGVIAFAFPSVTIDASIDLIYVGIEWTCETGHLHWTVDTGHLHYDA